MYYDLHVPWTEENTNTLPKTILALEQAGYGAIAITHTVRDKLPKTKCPFSKFPSSPSLRQYTRLNLVLNDPQQNYGINAHNEIIRSYDFVSIQPETEKMFQIACTSLDADLITLDFTTRLPFPIRHGYVRQAAHRGVKFEILYSPSLKEPSARRNVIGNALVLSRVCGGKNLVVSSGAEFPWQVRAPFDVINLCGLFGIPSHLRKQCITATCLASFMHCGTRKHTYRAAVSIIPSEPITDMAEDFFP